MKPWHAAHRDRRIAACCAGVWALQRTADFGFGNDDSPTNVKAEFYWSRLAYILEHAELCGGFGGFGTSRLVQLLVARLSQGRPPVSHRHAPADAH